MKYLYLIICSILLSINATIPSYATSTKKEIIKTSTSRQLSTKGTNFFKVVYYSDGSIISTQIPEQEFDQINEKKEIPAIFKENAPFPAHKNIKQNINNTHKKTPSNETDISTNPEQNTEKRQQIYDFNEILHQANNTITNQADRAKFARQLAHSIQSKPEDYFIGHERIPDFKEGFWSGFQKGNSSTIYQTSNNKLTPNAATSAYIGYYFGKFSLPIFIVILASTYLKHKQNNNKNKKKKREKYVK
ncbi:MAG: hypothetical protein IJN91_05070 [Alphaproteobacteria bacterium]|nr:hypothetical protein [Alphaproteobacteria bacterium]